VEQETKRVFFVRTIALLSAEILRIDSLTDEEASKENLFIEFIEHESPFGEPTAYFDIRTTKGFSKGWTRVSVERIM